MASTFDIRFARSVGLAALFEAPANHFRWKGAGKLIVEAQGIRIAVERGLLSLFGRHDCRIPAGQLTEVYREGDGLRIEYGSGAQRTVVPVWARDPETAARIVKLLPTPRTVELEQVSRAHRYRLDWRLLLFLMMGALVLAVVAVWLQQSHRWNPAPPQTLSSSPEHPQNAGVVTSPEGGRSEPEEVHQPASISFGAVRNAGRASVPGVGQMSAPVRPESATSSVAPQNPGAEAVTTAGNVSGYVEPFSGTPAAPDWIPAETLMWELFEYENSRNDANNQSWWEFSVQINTNPRFQHQDLWALRENMLAISRAWRSGDSDMARRLTVDMRRNF